MVTPKACPAVWERLQSDSIGFRHEPDIFIPISSSLIPDTNNQNVPSSSEHQITSTQSKDVIDYQINNQKSLQENRDDSAHHVSLCMNDVRTTLFIEENAFNDAKATMNSNNNGGKGI